VLVVPDAMAASRRHATRTPRIPSLRYTEQRLEEQVRATPMWLSAHHTRRGGSVRRIPFSGSYKPPPPKKTFLTPSPSFPKKTPKHTKTQIGA